MRWWRKRYEEITDIQWCPVHHGYLNEDSHRCDASWWAPGTHDLDCRSVAVYIERRRR